MNIMHLNILLLLALFNFFNLTASAGPKHFVLHDFGQTAAGWTIEDDGVMGGVSRGTFAWDPQGYGVFAGEVSLDHNGGFSSVQYYFDPVDIAGHTTACLRVKGDGKVYRFIVEAEPDARHYYEASFRTSGEWETVHIPLSSMVPKWRGDVLDQPNFTASTLAQVRLMIANGLAESFHLNVEKIWLE